MPSLNVDTTLSLFNQIMRYDLHFNIHIEVDVNAVDPSAIPPDPGEDPEPVECDGTISGYDDSVVPPAEALENKIESWWTGPWPRYHTKIDQTTEDGISVKYDVSSDILGAMVIEEEMDIQTNDPDDPIDEPDFPERVGELMTILILKNWPLELGLILADIATTIFSAGAEKTANLIAAVAACAAWTALFSVYLAIVVSDICNETDDPFLRFWVIFMLGITICLGISLADIIKDLGVHLIQGLGNCKEFFWAKTTGSLTWMLWKLLCTLMVFLLAGAILVGTLLGTIE